MEEPAGVNDPARMFPHDLFTDPYLTSLFQQCQPFSVRPDL